MVCVPERNIMNPQYDPNIRAISYPLRLYSGANALDNLPAEQIGRAHV